LGETALNPNRFRDDLAGSAQLLGASYVEACSSADLSISTRIAVVGNGNFDVGNDTPRKTGKPIVEQMKGSGSPGTGNVKQMQAGQPADCGAMSQQGSFSYHGNVSSPQQLLHLVGCRDPKVRYEKVHTGPQVRPAPQRR
jgi:hypothetical protein